MLAQVRTLVAKLIGVVFSIAAGLVAGKEGPFVHGGGIVGGGIGSMGSQCVDSSNLHSCSKPPSALSTLQRSMINAAPLHPTHGICRLCLNERKAYSDFL